MAALLEPAGELGELEISQKSPWLPAGLAELGEPAPPGSKISFLADGRRSGPWSCGDPIFFHTFQRRSNRDPAIILDGSTGSYEILLTGKSLIPPNSNAPMGAENGGNLESETTKSGKCV